jgi:hypothetical protein
MGSMKASTVLPSIMPHHTVVRGHVSCSVLRERHDMTNGHKPNKLSRRSLLEQKVKGQVIMTFEEAFGTLTLLYA